MSKIAGVTVLYNPDISVLENIYSYLNQVDLLYVVNNSDEKLSTSINTFLVISKVKLIENSHNLGMAYALNQAANQAIIDGFDFLLTMDQDSKVSGNLVETMLRAFLIDEKIAILSPFVVHNANPKRPHSSDREEITVAMTSGSIINLSAHKVVGGFLEIFFIDYVDHEYCLRMISHGYKIYQLNTVHIYHELGEIKPHDILFKKVFPTNHCPLRLYYRTRNRFFVYERYKCQFADYVRNDKKSFIKELIKILLYEKYKIKKFVMIIRGYIDYRRNKFGKYKGNS